MDYKPIKEEMEMDEVALYARYSLLYRVTGVLSAVVATLFWWIGTTTVLHSSIMMWEKILVVFFLFIVWILFVIPVWDLALTRYFIFYPDRMERHRFVGDIALVRWEDALWERRRDMKSFSRHSISWIWYEHDRLIMRINLAFIRSRDRGPLLTRVAQLRGRSPRRLLSTCYRRPFLCSKIESLTPTPKLP